MPVDRRQFLQRAALVAAGSVAAPAAVEGAPAVRIKAIAFDGLAVFDARPVFVLAEQLFPGRGTELGNAWRARQFEYTWLRTVMNRYADFQQVTGEALVFASKMLKLDLTDEKRQRLMQAFQEIKAWPDAPKALEAFRAAGIRMALLSNFTAAMLDRAVANSNLEGFFEPHLSTDRVRAFKPDPRAYELGVQAFGLKREEIAFAAFGGWDAAGARAFGYPTYWVNRLGLPPEELGVTADATGAHLDGLVNFVLG